MFLLWILIVLPHSFLCQISYTRSLPVVQLTTVNPVCNQQLKYFQESFDAHALWARQMHDSWGKIPSGLFSGNVYDFGSFDQCINLKLSSVLGKITGQHCTLMIPVDMGDGEESAAKILPPSRRLLKLKFWKIVEFFEKILKLVRFISSQINMGIGVCLPASCSPDEVKIIADDYLMASFNTTTAPFYDQSSFCATNQQTFEFNALQILAMWVAQFKLIKLFILVAYPRSHLFKTSIS